MYSDTVLEHFNNPRNVGFIPDADGVGLIGSSICGDMIKIFVKIKDNRIEDVKFQTFGCGAAIATSSMITEMVKGKTIEEAREVTNEMVAEALGGLPPGKMHCSNLAADAMHKALDEYEGRVPHKSRAPLFKKGEGVRGGRGEIPSEEMERKPES
ncbi:MAG TPA: Fe-S cluster assembly scaffold protein NifU [Dehalococcoidia bacterium]|nr:Fe-S cluster assembly scaffold protein NifU [Dehalococcoidia bacterium]